MLELFPSSRFRSELFFFFFFSKNKYFKIYFYALIYNIYFFEDKDIKTKIGYLIFIKRIVKEENNRDRFPKGQIGIYQRLNAEKVYGSRFKRDVTSRLTVIYI